MRECRRPFARIFLALLYIVVALSRPLVAQEREKHDRDPLQQIITGFRLNQESILDGIAKLSETSNDIGFSIERELGTRSSATLAKPREFSHAFPAEPIEQILNDLVHLDSTYAWSRDGNMVNVFPSAMKDEKTYVMNRLIPLLKFNQEPNAVQSVFHAVAQLPPPREQIATLEIGKTNFPTPWTETFAYLSVRAALNRIASHMGPTYGWQLSGKQNFRIVSFHAKLSAAKSAGSAK